MFPEISVSVYLIYECYRLTDLHTYILTELLLEVLADLKNFYNKSTIDSLAS